MALSDRDKKVIEHQVSSLLKSIYTEHGEQIKNISLQFTEQEVIEVACYITIMMVVNTIAPVITASGNNPDVINVVSEQLCLGIVGSLADLSNLRTEPVSEDKKTVH